MTKKIIIMLQDVHSQSPSPQSVSLHSPTGSAGVSFNSPNIGLQTSIQQQQQQSVACRKTPDEFFEKSRSYRGSEYFEKSHNDSQTHQITINGNAMNGWLHFLFNTTII